MIKALLPLFIIVFYQLLGITVKNDERDENNSAPIHAGWSTGVALYSFNQHSFVKAVAMAKEAGVNSLEGFSFHKMGAEFGDSTMGALSLEGIGKVRQIMKNNGMSMGSMYVDGARNAAEWTKFFQAAKELNMKYLVCEPPKSQWDMIDSLAGKFNIKIAITPVPTSTSLASASLNLLISFK